MKTFKEVCETICKEFLKRYTIRFDKIITEEDYKCFDKKNNRSRIGVKRIIHFGGFPEFEIHYHKTYKKYFLYKIKHNQPKEYLGGDENFDKILEIMRSIINCEDK